MAREGMDTLGVEGKKIQLSTFYLPRYGPMEEGVNVGGTDGGDGGEDISLLPIISKKGEQQLDQKVTISTESKSCAGSGEPGNPAGSGSGLNIDEISLKNWVLSPGMVG